MKMFNSYVSMIEAGKVSVYELRNLMGYINRKPNQYYEAAMECLQSSKPKLPHTDTKEVMDSLRRELLSRDSITKKGVTKEQQDQFVLANNILVTGVKQNSLGEFLIHLPIYQIQYGAGELGFRFYFSANKPVFI